MFEFREDTVAAEKENRKIAMNEWMNGWMDGWVGGDLWILMVVSIMSPLYFTSQPLTRLARFVFRLCPEFSFDHFLRKEISLVFFFLAVSNCRALPTLSTSQT
jgi:hypothetical protein